MPESLGDVRVTILFGFPGFEGFIRVTLKYVNQLRVEQGNSELSFDEFIDEIIVSKDSIGGS